MNRLELFTWIKRRKFLLTFVWIRGNPSCEFLDSDLICYKLVSCRWHHTIVLTLISRNVCDINKFWNKRIHKLLHMCFQLCLVASFMVLSILKWNKVEEKNSSNKRHHYTPKGMELNTSWCVFREFQGPNIG